MSTKLNYLLSFALILLLAASLAAQNPGTANLTHLWTFEDGTLNDAIGDADGTPVGDNVLVDGGDLIFLPVELADGPGGDSWVEVPGPAVDIAAYDEVSVAAWFTPDPANRQWESLWFFGNDGDGAGVGSDGFAFQPRRNDNVARTWISCGNQTAPWTTEDGVNDPAGNYNDGNLHHVVCELNDFPEIVMYHNGVLIGTAPLTSDPATGKDNAIYNISPNFGRFGHSTYGDIPWIGTIHEIAIFNKALTDEEVSYLFDNLDWSAGLTAVDKNEAGALPGEFGLAQNYPNPFNPTTEISYTLKQREQVKLMVFDVLGREVATLVDGFQDSGKHDITFDAQGLTSGVYYYQLRTETGTLTKKMILMK
ncbi:hypothetical protein A2V82_02685 [candidate division KSB1 bacterium RBG_16_48_16]|nr:MAG: hypothetical protein A2V82_02685 [candidate division KSB1 bacterium RBG_16_48_16]